MEAKVRMICNLLGCKIGTGFAYSVYDSNGISPTLTTQTGGGRQPFIVQYEEDKKTERVIQ